MTAKTARKKPRASKRIRWSGQYRAMTAIHTARILREKEQDGKNAYSIIITTLHSRIVRMSKASTLEEAQEIARRRLS